MSASLKLNDTEIFSELNQTVTAKNINVAANDTTTPSMCKAWVNFDGTASGTNNTFRLGDGIRTAYNVSSVTDKGGSGYYDINLTNAMHDDKFCITTAVGNLAMTGSSDYARNIDAVPVDPSTIRCITFRSNDNASINVDFITIAVFR